VYTLGCSRSCTQPMRRRRQSGQERVVAPRVVASACGRHASNPSLVVSARRCCGSSINAVRVCGDTCERSLCKRRRLCVARATPSSCWTLNLRATCAGCTTACAVRSNDAVLCMRACAPLTCVAGAATCADGCSAGVRVRCQRHNADPCACADGLPLLRGLHVYGSSTPRS
jgi:hypothetical protein